MKIWMLKGLESRQERAAVNLILAQNMIAKNDLVLAQLIQGQNTDSESDVETCPSDKRYLNICSLKNDQHTSVNIHYHCLQ